MLKLATTSSVWRRALLLAALLAYAFAFLGSRGLWDPDEGRYTAVALEMLRSGDSIHPQLHPEHPHYTKPPLTYWAIEGAVAAFGHSEWAVRSPGALAFVLTLVLTYWLGRTYMPSRPWLPGAIYATTLLPYAAAGIVTTDTLLVAWETLAVAAFVAGMRRPSRYLQLLLWVGLGLAFLTKGPPGLLPLLAMVLFTVVRRDWAGLRRLFSGAGLAAFGVVGLSWYLAVVASAPQLWHYFVQYELIARVASATHHRHGEWYGALVVYLPTFVLGALPWSLLWLARLPKLRLSGVRKLAARFHNLAAPQQFLLLWLAVPLLVFVVARSRLPFYVLPLFVPLALLTARALPARLGLDGLVPRVALVATMALLVAGRWYGSGVGNGMDDRALAAEISRHMPDKVNELVFVDTEPRYGLRFYLDVPDEHVCLRDNCDLPGVARDESLDLELRQHEGPQLYLSRPALQSEVVAHARALGRTARELGQVQDLALTGVSGAVPPALETHAPSEDAVAGGATVE